MEEKFRIKVNPDLKAKIVFLITKKGIKTTKTNIEKFLKKIVENEIDKLFKKENNAN